MLYSFSQEIYSRPAVAIFSHGMRSETGRSRRKKDIHQHYERGKRLIDPVCQTGSTYHSFKDWCVGERETVNLVCTKES
jgi:hypothetical protein